MRKSIADGSDLFPDLLYVFPVLLLHLLMLNSNALLLIICFLLFQILID